MRLTKYQLDIIREWHADGTTGLPSWYDISGQLLNHIAALDTLIKAIGKMPDEWIKLTDSADVSPTEAQGMGTCIDQLRAKLKEHGYG